MSILQPAIETNDLTREQQLHLSEILAPLGIDISEEPSQFDIENEMLLGLHQRPDLAGVMGSGKKDLEDQLRRNKDSSMQNAINGTVAALNAQLAELNWQIEQAKKDVEEAKKAVEKAEAEAEEAEAEIIEVIPEIWDQIEATKEVEQKVVNSNLVTLDAQSVEDGFVGNLKTVSQDENGNF